MVTKSIFELLSASVKIFCSQFNCSVILYGPFESSPIILKFEISLNHQCSSKPGVPFNGRSKYLKKKSKLSEKDKKSWEDYIKNPSDVFDKDKTNSISTEKKRRFRFDLHGFTLDNANKKVREIIFSCSEKKYKEIGLKTPREIEEEKRIAKNPRSKNLKLKFIIGESQYVFISPT